MKKLVILFAAVLLALSTMQAVAKTTNRFVYLEATEHAIRDDAHGRIVLGIFDQSNANTPYGLQLVFEIDFSKLTCLGHFFVSNGVQFYVLYINEQRVLSFNTKCRYAATPGYVGGDFSTSLIFLDNDEWDSWLEYPVNDEIHAIVRIESHDDEPGLGPIVLEGWLEANE